MYRKYIRECIGNIYDTRKYIREFKYIRFGNILSKYIRECI